MASGVSKAFARDMVRDPVPTLRPTRSYRGRYDRAVWRRSMNRLDLCLAILYGSAMRGGVVAYQTTQRLRGADYFASLRGQFGVPPSSPTWGTSTARSSGWTAPSKPCAS
jgi:hypothetical protein